MFRSSIYGQKPSKNVFGLPPFPIINIVIMKRNKNCEYHNHLFLIQGGRVGAWGGWHNKLVFVYKNTFTYRHRR